MIIIILITIIPIISILLNELIHYIKIRKIKNNYSFINKEVEKFFCEFMEYMISFSKKSDKVNILYYDGEISLIEYNTQNHIGKKYLSIGKFPLQDIMISQITDTINTMIKYTEFNDIDFYLERNSLYFLEKIEILSSIIDAYRNRNYKEFNKLIPEFKRGMEEL